MIGSGKCLKKPFNVVRPAPLTLPEEDARRANKKKNVVTQNYMKDPAIWKNVFKFLDLKSLNRSLCVSKDWNRIGVDSSIWETIDLTQRLITF